MKAYSDATCLVLFFSWDAQLWKTHFVWQFWILNFKLHQILNGTTWAIISSQWVDITCGNKQTFAIYNVSVDTEFNAILYSKTNYYFCQVPQATRREKFFNFLIFWFRDKDDNEEYDGGHDSNDSLSFELKKKKTKEKKNSGLIQNSVCIRLTVKVSTEKTHQQGVLRRRIQRQKIKKLYRPFFCCNTSYSNPFLLGPPSALVLTILYLFLYQIWRG